MVTVDIFRFEGADAVPFPAGAEIFTQGDPGDLMYVVLEGKVRIAVHGDEVEQVGPGGVLTPLAASNGVARGARAAHFHIPGVVASLCAKMRTGHATVSVIRWSEEWN